jgi:hypothetical protein
MPANVFSHLRFGLVWRRRSKGVRSQTLYPAELRAQVLLLEGELADEL